MFGQGSARFRTTDFFGIVLPGAYLVCELGVLLLLFVSPDIKLEDAKNLGSLWAPILVLLLFVSYLIGSVFRTWAVDDTDDKFAALFPEYSDERPEETAFPYRERLKRGKDAVCLAMSKGDLEVVFRQYARAKAKNLDQLSPTDKETALRDYLPPFGLARSRREQGKFGGEPKEPLDSPGGQPRELPSVEPWGDDITILYRGNHIHNFWKAVLCVSNASGFEFAEASEARTRFFFGMLCAARWSLRIMFFTAAALSIWLIYGTSLSGIMARPSAGVLVQLEAAGFVAAFSIFLLEIWGDRRSRRAKDVEHVTWDKTQQNGPRAVRAAKRRVEEVLAHPSWNLARAARRVHAELVNFGLDEEKTEGREQMADIQPAQNGKKTQEEREKLAKKLSLIIGVIKDPRKAPFAPKPQNTWAKLCKRLGNSIKEVASWLGFRSRWERKTRNIVESLEELLRQLRARRQKKIFQTRVWFWAPLTTEVVLTPLLLVNTNVCLGTAAPIHSVAPMFLLTTTTALLFLFLARRLRRVRAREMRAVYINHVALVLASYRAEAKDAD